MKALIMVPQIEDVILSLGGTVAKLSGEGMHVSIVAVTSTEDDKRRSGESALDRLGSLDITWLEGVEAGHAKDMVHADLNRIIGNVVRDTKPEVIFIPFPEDARPDYNYIFESCLVAVRPNRPDIPSRVYAYKSITGAGKKTGNGTPEFEPDTFLDISDFLNRKLHVLKILDPEENHNINDLRPTEEFALIRSVHKRDNPLDI